MKTKDNNFKTQLSQKADLINTRLAQMLETWPNLDENLREPLAYTLLSGGKRIRAAITLWCCEMVSGDINPDAITVAMAIEMVHTYSLIHDDLPAMDDDDWRRGKASCHKAFDEATAILTGDSLLTMAFELLATDISQPAKAVALISELSQAAGPAAMIAGQIADIKAEHSRGDQALLDYIHANKTAKMFRCASVCGGLCADASQDQLKLLSDYGLKTGLGFQISDDILDVCGNSDKLGKTAGKDAKAGKLTYPSLIGLAQAKKQQQLLANDSLDILAQFGESAVILKQLTTALLKRQK